MKTSIAVIAVLGITYLFLLETMGDFVTRELNTFYGKLMSTGEEIYASERNFRNALLRKPVDDLLDLVQGVGTDEESSLPTAEEAKYMRE